VRAVATYLVWWIGLFWLWFFLQGEWNRIEWVAAACEATLGAAFASVLATRGLLRLRVPLAAFRAAKRVPLQVVIDFAIVTAFLARRLAGRRVHGRFVVREYAGAAHGPKARVEGEAAWRALTATFSPNALVIDVDPDGGISYFHDLKRNRASEEPA
jgi:multisubunit Na+/H+ antiporter MnhE subunit